MPTNLPPEAVEAEKRYKEARELPEKISRLEEFMALIPKHKGTDKLRAGLRKRLSKLREQLQAGKKKTGGRGAEAAWRIEREGSGQVSVIGPPNAGKSALLAALTKAEPEVAEYPWTTRTPIPGMMTYENVQIQLIDTPPLTREHVEPELIDLIRRADAALLVVDLQGDALGQLDDAAGLLAERKIVPRHLRPEEEQRGVVYPPLLVLVNKCDDEAADGDFEVFCELLPGEWPLLAVSASAGRGLDGLRHRVFEMLGIMRVYSRPPGKKADMTSPFTLPIGSTVEEFAAAVHGDLRQQLKTARVWGAGVHDGQTVSRDHVLHEGDVVELRV
ncbi:MAG: GTPase [Planctomycetota bacterium]